MTALGSRIAGLVAAAVIGVAPSASAGPVGTILFWTDVGTPAIWRMDADGSHRRAVGNVRGSAKRDAIWLVHPDGSDRHRLRSGAFPVWSPDGRRLAFAQQFRGRFELYETTLPSGRVRRLTNTPSEEFPAAWSPDGRLLLFTVFSTRAPESDVAVLDLARRRVSRLTSAPGLDSAEDWSPDGRRILFTSERTGRAQIFVMRSDGRSPRNLSRNTRNEYATSWR